MEKTKQVMYEMIARVVACITYGKLFSCYPHHPQWVSDGRDFKIRQWIWLADNLLALGMGDLIANNPQDVLMNGIMWATDMMIARKFAYVSLS